MLKIFIGLFFLFLDYNVRGISLTPTFVGYLLIWKGMGEMEGCITYQNGRSLALIAVGVSGLYWLRSFVDQSYGTVGMLFMMAVIILQLLVTQILNNGVLEMQNRSGIDLRGRHLVIMWNITAVGSITVIVARLLLPVLAVAAALIYFAGCVGYIAFYYQAYKLRKISGGEL